MVFWMKHKRPEEEESAEIQGQPSDTITLETSKNDGGKRRRNKKTLVMDKESVKRRNVWLRGFFHSSTCISQEEEEESEEEMTDDQETWPSLDHSTTSTTLPTILAGDDDTTTRYRDSPQQREREEELPPHQSQKPEQQQSQELFRQEQQQTPESPPSHRRHCSGDFLFRNMRQGDVSPGYHRMAEALETDEAVEERSQALSQEERPPSRTERVLRRLTGNGSRSRDRTVSPSSPRRSRTTKFRQQQQQQQQHASDNDPNATTSKKKKKTQSSSFLDLAIPSQNEAQTEQEEGNRIDSVTRRELRRYRLSPAALLRRVGSGRFRSKSPPPVRIKSPQAMEQKQDHTVGETAVPTNPSRDDENDEYDDDEGTGGSHSFSSIDDVSSFSDQSLHFEVVDFHDKFACDSCLVNNPFIHMLMGNYNEDDQGNDNKNARSIERKRYKQAFTSVHQKSISSSANTHHSSTGASSSGWTSSSPCVDSMVPDCAALAPIFIPASTTLNSSDDEDDGIKKSAAAARRKIRRQRQLRRRKA